MQMYMYVVTFTLARIQCITSDKSILEVRSLLPDLELLRLPTCISKLVGAQQQILQRLVAPQGLCQRLPTSIVNLVVAQVQVLKGLHTRHATLHKRPENQRNLPVFCGLSCMSPSKRLYLRLKQLTPGCASAPRRCARSPRCRGPPAGRPDTTSCSSKRLVKRTSQ